MRWSNYEQREQTMSRSSMQLKHRQMAELTMAMTAVHEVSVIEICPPLLLTDPLTAATKSRMFIIRSLLPANILAQMAIPNSTLAAPVNDVNERVDGEAFDSDGVMLDWKRANSELGSIGLLFFILSLILLNGRSISDGECTEYRPVRSSSDSSDVSSRRPITIIPATNVTRSTEAATFRSATRLQQGSDGRRSHNGRLSADSAQAVVSRMRSSRGWSAWSHVDGRQSRC